MIKSVEACAQRYHDSLAGQHAPAWWLCLTAATFQIDPPPADPTPLAE